MARQDDCGVIQRSKSLESPASRKPATDGLYANYTTTNQESSDEFAGAAVIVELEVPSHLSYHLWSALRRRLTRDGEILRSRPHLLSYHLRIGPLGGWIDAPRQARRGQNHWQGVRNNIRRTRQTTKSHGCETSMGIIRGWRRWRSHAFGNASQFARSTLA
jgi:hypothetical protein